MHPSPRPAITRLRSTLVLGLPLLLVAAACGDTGTDVVGGSPTSSRPGSPPPAGGALVAVQVLDAGGFLPLEAAVTTVPRITVLTDGTVITPAAVEAIYPGPALAPLRSSTAPVTRVDALLERAGVLGLLDGPLEFGRPPVADAPDTIVTLASPGGGTVIHTAYALGLASPEERPGTEPGTEPGAEPGSEPGAEPGTEPGAEPGAEPGTEPTTGPATEPGSGADLQGLTEAELANRRALAELVAAAEDLTVGQGADGQPWTPPAVAVLDLGPYESDPELPQPPVAWPLADPPATAPASTGPGVPGIAGPGSAVCTLVEGGPLSRLLDALSGATTLTPWLVDGAGRHLAFRPVVPGRPGCEV